MNKTIDDFIDSQIKRWDTAYNNYKALNDVITRTIVTNGIPYTIQYNPSRIVSSGANVDQKSIQKRQCFLCRKNRPKEQIGLDYKGNYTILVNPFPIFSKHLTIPTKIHVCQSIKNRFHDMLDLAYDLNEFIIFYNGPKCGASAPDHAHFQAGNKGFLPLEKYWVQMKKHIAYIKEAQISISKNRLSKMLIIESHNKESIIDAFNIIYNTLPIHNEEETEPMMNILVMYENKQWIVFIFPREKHRPECYYAAGDNNILLSPASVDMAGVLITPLEKDFKKITEQDINKIMSEVCIDDCQMKNIITKITNSLSL